MEFSKFTSFACIMSPLIKLTSGGVFNIFVCNKTMNLLFTSMEVMSPLKFSFIAGIWQNQMTKLGCVQSLLCSFAVAKRSHFEVIFVFRFSL